MTTPSVDDFALVGITPTPVPTEVLLRALLAQEDHYVAEEILELEALAGVESRTGFAAALRWDGLADLERLLDTLPPSCTFRADPAAPGIGAVFYRKYPTTEIVKASKIVLASMSEAREAIVRAIQRWGYRYENDDIVFLPWDYSYPEGQDDESIAFHLRRATEGDGAALLALALGRMNPDYPVSVGCTRWMFPAGTP